MQQHRGYGLQTPTAGFHLLVGEFEKARSDLELILFNQTLHPWELAQDKFLRAFKASIDLEQIPFDLIRLLEVDWPASAIVGDTVELRLSVLHLASCSPHIPAFEINLKLEPKRLSVYQETVDPVVTKTTFVQSFLIYLCKGCINWLKIFCDTSNLSVNLPSVTVIDLNKSTAVEKRSVVTFPNVRELSSAGDWDTWTLHQSCARSKGYLE